MIEKDAPPPPELTLSWKCQSYQALPDAGGLLDQDHRLMHRMGVLENIYRTVAKVRSARGDQIHALTGSERILLRRLSDEGLWLVSS